MRIVGIDGETAICEIDGVKREASLMMIEDAQVGDFVLIHAGFAMEKLDRTDAEETLQLFRRILAESGDAE